MLKAITYGVLILCANILLKTSWALERAGITRSVIISTPNSSTIPFNGHLYTVSKNQSHIHVNSSDSNYQPCDIAIDASRDVTRGHLEVTPTEDEIFIVGIQSIAADDQYKYAILRVDPTACSYQSASIPETKDARGDERFPRLTKCQMGVDVFFPSLQNCAPCRLNNADLTSRDATPQIPRESTSYSAELSVDHDVRFVNSLNAYFYVYNRRNHATGEKLTTLKLLDSHDFATKKERTIDFSVNAVSKQKKSIERLGICSKTYDPSMADIVAYSEVRCDRLDSNLDTANTIRISIPRSKPVSSISYEFDKEGNSYISFAENKQLRLYIHDKDGKLIKDIDMGAVDGRFQQYPDYDPEYFAVYDYWNVNGFLVGDEYCVVTGQSAIHYPTPLHHVRCVDVKQYIKH